MPQKCETISHYCPTPYRDPRKRASSLKTVWRFTTMHLKPYPKPQKKEIRELGQDGTQTFHVDQQGIIRTEWGVRQACGHIGLPGNGTANRCPLSDVSTNTLCCATNNCSGQLTRGHSWPCKSKASCPDATFPSSLHLLSTSAGLENEGSLRIYQEEDGEASLDIWAVIKPGNTKEKIAIFTAQKGSQTVAGGSNKPSDRERTTQDTRTISMKSKGCWHGDWCVAKRRKRSGNSDKPKTILQQNTEIRMSPMTKENSDPHSDMAREVMRTEGEEGEKTLSVVEMVAYLEQRASVQQIESKPPLRSSSTIILSKAGALLCLAEQVSRDQQLSEVHEEEESVRVLDMVAKLESQCLSRQSLGEGGNLSRSNSLQRRVGRVLLAGCEPCSMSALSRLPPDNRAEEAPEQMPSDVDLPECPPNAHVSVQTSNSESLVKCLREKQEVGNEAYQEIESIETETMKDQVKGINDRKEEPLPGMLFFACSSPKTLQKEKCERIPMSEDIKPSWNGQENEHTGALPLKQVLNPLLATLSPTGEHHSTLQNNGNVEEAEVVEVSGINKNHVPLRRLVSHEFLETRFKIQLLLEPQQYMAFLPHHIIVKIFSLLPTKSLAALKCTCHYFKFIIENYGVRPADSRWVSDPHYKDDPCKQCKKRYKRGDVSLCRWHHKPFCQALPYGPGYWMCCREPRKDTPGCNVGLHDNRWVPTFHSINMPIYKKSRDNEEDV